MFFSIMGQIKEEEEDLKKASSPMYRDNYTSDVVIVKILVLFRLQLPSHS